MKYVVGVDAGGTCTSAAAYAMDGRRICSAETGPGNVTAGGPAAEENILRAARCCLDAAGAGCVRIVVGTAGLDEAVTPGRLCARLKELCRADADVVPDGLLALYAAHLGGDGILVVSGTGSIAYGKRGTETFRRGGWGHILGDAGSGYAIAAEAIRLALQDLDDGLLESGLTAALREASGAGRLRDLVERVYGRPKAETAALAQAVTAQCALGDARAAAILDRAGNALAELALALSARLGLAAPRIAVSGGILVNAAATRLRFMKCIADKLPGAVIVESTVEPQKGALYIYRERKGADDHAD